MTSASLSKQGVKAIVFDLDGTLYQDDRLGEQVNQAACRYIASINGITVAKAEEMLQQARNSISDPGGTLSRAVIALGGNLKDLHQRMCVDVHPEALLREDPRVPELLKLLARRFELHLYTNNNRELSGRIMARLGVTGLFGKVFSIEDHWRPKPDRVALMAILEEIGRKPAETLFVGDRYEVDLALAASLGCPTFEAKTVEELLKLAELTLPSPSHKGRGA